MLAMIYDLITSFFVLNFLFFFCIFFDGLVNSFSNFLSTDFRLKLQKNTFVATKLDDEIFVVFIEVRCLL
jgi:hypothetical protein